MENNHKPPGPPYAPKTAGVGGIPKVDVDIPILAVFLALYLIGAAGNMFIFTRNRKSGHYFFMSTACFGFCMSRVVTCILRIAWTTRAHNTRLAIAALIFTNAGVLVLYIVAQVLAQRILRATQPLVGYSRLVKMVSAVSYGIMPVALALVIAFAIVSFYTLDAKLRNAALWVQRASLLYFVIFNIISAVTLALPFAMPRSPKRQEFGVGPISAKRIILGTVLFFVLFTSGFRAGTIWADPRPASDPAWYDTKAAFYVLELAFEIIIVYLLLFTRFDRRFWVPDGSKQPGDYHQIDQARSSISMDEETASSKDEELVKSKDEEEA